MLKQTRPRSVLLLLPLALAPLRAQTSLNLSTDLTTLGIASGNMVPNQPALDSVPLLESAMKYVSSHKTISTVTANPGSYYFLSTSSVSSGSCVTISGISSPTTIDFQGSDFYFQHTEKMALTLQSLTNVTVQNFTVDFLQLPYTQIQISAVNASQKQLTIAAMPGWQTPTALASALGSVLDTSGSPPAYLFVFRNGLSWLGSNQFAVQQPWTDTSLTLGSSVSTSTAATLQPGDQAVLYYRGGNTQSTLGIFANSITNCAIKNATVYTGVVGVRTVNCPDLLLQRVYVIPRPGTTRFVGSTAGGIVPAQMGQNTILRLCRVIRECDDAYAPNCYLWGQVQSVLGSTSLQLAGDNSGGAATALGSNQSVPNGATVTFEGANGALLGTAVISSQTAAAAIDGVPQLIVAFTGALPSGVAAGSWVCLPPSLTGGGLAIERCSAQQQAWGHGIILWGLNDAAIYGSYVYNSAWAGVELLNQLITDDWLVGSLSNIEVANNVLDGLNVLPTPTTYSATAGGIFSFSFANPLATGSCNQNLTAAGNFVANPGSAGIFVGDMNGASVNSNYLLNPGNEPNASLQYAQFQSLVTQPIAQYASQSVALGLNMADSASGRVFVTDTSYNQLAAYPPGGTIRLNAYEVGTLGNPSAVLTDADGSAYTLPIVATATHSIDVALPLGADLGGASIALTAGGGSYFGTLFIDSQDNVPAINQATFQIGPSSAEVPASGGAAPFLVVTQAGANVTVADTDSFVTPGAGIAGTGVVSVSLAANPGAKRTTTVLIASQPFTIAQAGANDPVIKVQPQSQTVVSGGSASFNVSATGATSYQWYLNGTAIPGASGASLAITGATSANSGTYTVQAINAAGTMTSQGALLSMATPGAPVVLFHPAGQVAVAGSNVTFSVTATGSTGLTYQWSFDDTPIPGATNPALTLSNVQSANEGFYSVVVANANGAGPTITNFATLKVNSAGPSFSLQPASLTIVNGTTTSFSVAAAGATTYQWYFDGAPLSNGGAIAGATGPALLITGATSANQGTYYCLVTGPTGLATSSPATLTIDTKAADAANPGRLANLSVNTSITSLGANSGLSMGFISGGAGTSGSEQLLIRALGPLIGTLGIPGTLADPTLTVINQATAATSAQNSGWGTPASNATAVEAADSALFALPLTNTSSADAAIVSTLPENGSGYSVNIIGKAGTASDNGTVVAEVWDDTANYTLTTPRLVNLSCRQLLAAKTGSLTAGFVIGGSTAKTVLIRAMGPTLASFGLSPAMPDPELQVYVLGATSAFNGNTNWGGNPLITQVNNQVFAFNPASATSADSELVVTLPPGEYTAQATSASGTAGLVQVEVFEVP